jgi:hypothetical protein
MITNPCCEIELPMEKWYFSPRSHEIVRLDPWRWSKAELAELYEWCRENHCKPCGNDLIILPDQAARTLFSMRWDR